MLLRWLLASLHLLALPLGLGSVWIRARALRSDPLDDRALARVFVADSWWGVAAGLWIVTGLIRAFTGLEKGPGYYLRATPFHVKIGLLVLILILEIGPMVTLIRWRMAMARGEPIDLTSAPRLARISEIQAALVILMVLAATALARGFFF